MVVAKAVRNSQTGSGKKGDSTQTGKRAPGKGAPAKRQSRNAQAKQRAQARSGQKQGFKLSRFLRDVRAELAKVTWPTREQTRNLTVLVFVVSAAIGVYISVWDLLFTKIIQVMTNS